LNYLQPQFDGTTINFEKQGVGVYRNGVLVYSQTQPILASNVNGTPITFSFPNTSDFVSDGSAAVVWKVVFGLVHRLKSSLTGYDNLTLMGTCGESPTPMVAVLPTTCGVAGANSDGKITLSNFGATDKFDFTTGSTYTGGKTYTTATAIPAGGIITSTLPNPATPQVYTVRVFTASGCTYDLQTTLNPSVCPICTTPTATFTPTPATCTGTSVNNNASIALTGVSGGDKVGISGGSVYTGVSYANAQTLTGGGYTFSALPNPAGSQVYTLRVFNLSLLNLP
jgi:hypothetical protein